MKFFRFFAFIVLCSCSRDRIAKPLFTDITQASGINFRNDLAFTERLNPYTYRNFYNGAGVAIGDINNDGLLDIYFAGNQVDNKLYLNQGNLSFKDITNSAGVACSDVWSTGVTFVDINADGFLDIYVCKSGSPDAPRRYNELFINNGDLTFSERSKEYGLDVVGLSVQAAFFDYDKDEDLDCYLLTNSIRSVGSYDLVKDQRNIPDPQGGGNKFFINQDGKFIDYSNEAGIYRSNIGFGLGITLGDFNNDSWTDIFVSNDFFERDYLYINNKKGGFTESLTDYFQSISMGSMGADLADLDNDGFPELFVTEMLPDSLHRKKTKTVYESWDKHQLNIQSGYHNQFPRNVLHKKIGNNSYAEIGRLAGVAASEWSWGALLFDMDNDGRRDIFIANGIYKDLLDRDYLTYTAAEDRIRKMVREEKDVIIKLIDLMPSSQFSNYAFKNEGKLSFKNVAKEWGLDLPMYSCGSAYGDLDNDGDLDLVLNNINAPSILYRNNSDSAKFKSLSLSLSLKDKNTYAVGTKITAYCGENIFFADNFVTRGFQSSVQPRIHIGFGEDTSKTIDSLVIQWPNDGYSILYNVSKNQSLNIKHEAIQVFPGVHPRRDTENTGLPFTLEKISYSNLKHQASAINDFNRERLLPMMYSNETPSLIKGDINNDGHVDVYMDRGKGLPAAVIELQGDNVKLSTSEIFNQYSLAEETKGTFLDVDNDGDLDLYTSTGGRFFPKTSSVLLDRILLNDGKGRFTESPHQLPSQDFFSTSVAEPFDFDNDGDVDLFVGERFHPFSYGIGGKGYLLQNDGKGLFQDVTRTLAPALLEIGMVTDVTIQDYNNDGWKDLIIVGDWMPIVMMQNNKGSFSSASSDSVLQETEGWWHDIEAADLNNDGKVDFVLGNHGLNTFFKSGDRMYVNDFDGNGSIEQIFCTKVDEKYYPLADKDEFLSQLPSLKKQLLYYKDYGKKSIDQLFPEQMLRDSKVFEVKLLASVIWLSSKQGYQRVELPLEAQYSPIYSLLIADLDNDGIQDLIAGGNHYLVKPQFGRYDASNGWFFKGTLNNGQFSFKNGIDLNIKGQIRDIEYLEVNKTKYILFAKYDDDLEIYKISY